MKTNLKRKMAFFAVLMLAALLIASCSPVIDNSGAAYLEVEKSFQWKYIYQLGETLSLDGLTAKYYPNIENTDFEVVTLTKDMITGFDSSKTGTFTMTVTYKGKTDTIDYTIVPKATPFELVKSFCIAENTVVSINTTSMKATVFVFDNYFKAIENHPSKTEEKGLSYLVNGSGETCVSFEYNGSRFDIFNEKETNRYYMLTSLIDNGTSSNIKEQFVHPISLDTLPLPNKNVVYKSDLNDGVYYSILVDDDCNAVVTKHEVTGETTVDTVVDSYAATDAVLSANGLFKYSQHKDGASATATMSQEGQFRIRKESTGNSELIYSVFCSPTE